MHDPISSKPFLLPLMTGEELAAALRYSGVTSAFRTFIKNLGIQPVPGRINIYDPRHVRHQLDAAHGILPSDPGVATPIPMSETEKRRARRGK